MNEILNNNLNNNTNKNKSHSKEKNINYFSAFPNMGNNINRYLSENQRNITKFISQKKNEKISKNKNYKNSEAILISFNNNNINNINNIKINNYTNLITKPSKIVKNSKSKKRNHYASKPKLEIEINNRNNSNNVSTNYKKNNNKKYKKNISEHDLINNLLNTFSNYNNSKGVNIKLNFTSKKKLISDKNKINKKGNNTVDTRIYKQNNARHISDNKLLRSSSGYSYINSNIAQTNGFYNVNNSNQLGYISTCANIPELSNSNFTNLMKISNQKNNNNNRNRNKSSKGPYIGKIIKNIKNNDLNCIFNMNLIPPASQANNIQDYLKNLYNIEYNSDYRIKKNKNKKGKDININENKEKERDEYTNSKNTMTKTNDISKIKKDNYSINTFKYNNDSPEEIHFYVISSIQNSKNMEFNLAQK